MATDPNQPEFQQVNRMFETSVIKERNFNAIEHIYTADACILPPGAEMLTGLDHIRNFWEQAVSTLNIQALTLSTLDLQIQGETAVEIGRAEMHTNQPTSPTTVKYVVVWKHDNGSWKWAVDIWNADAEARQQQ